MKKDSVVIILFIAAVVAIYGFLTYRVLQNHKNTQYVETEYVEYVREATVLRKTLEGRYQNAIYLHLDDGISQNINRTASENLGINLFLLDRGDKITYTLDETGNIIVLSIEWSGDTGDVTILPNGLHSSTITHSVLIDENRAIAIRLENKTYGIINRTDSEKMGNEVLHLQKGDKITYYVDKYGSIVVCSIQWN